MLLQPFKNHLECPARHFAFYHAVFYADSYFIFIVPRMEVGGVFCLFFWFVLCFPILPKGVACCVLPIFAGEWGESVNRVVISVIHIIYFGDYRLLLSWYLNRK